MNRPRIRRGSEDGYILVAVLGVMLLLTGLMAAGSVLLRSSLHSVRLVQDDVVMSGLEQSGLEITAYQLFVLDAPPNLVGGRSVRLANATITPSIVDEGGKVDLNGSDPKLLLSVFDSVGIDAGAATELVARILALRGPPPASPSAAISASALPQGDPPPPGAAKKPRGFQSVEQLAGFPGLSGADLAALATRLTVFNPDGKVNILTASEDVLAAIPGLSRPTAVEILARRQNADKKVVQNLQGLLGNAASYTKVEPGPAYSVRIAVVSRDGRRARVDAVIGASKSPSLPYYVLDWRD